MRGELGDASDRSTLRRTIFGARHHAHDRGRRCDRKLVEESPPIGRIDGEQGLGDMRRKRRIARQAFLVLEKAWQLEGGTLVDLKVEFGYDTKGRLLLADVIDNDSWRVVESGSYIDKQVYRDGGALDDVAEKYRRVAGITGHFRVPRQRIVLWRGSESDKTEPFADALGDAKEMMTVVTCSVHKQPVLAARTLQRLLQDVPDTVVIANIVAFFLVRIVGRNLET